MKKLIIIFACALLVACSPTSKLPTLSNQADAAFTNANYTAAYALYKEYMDIAKATDVKVDDGMFVNLAKCCAQLDKVDEAKERYQQLIKDDKHLPLIAEYTQMLQKNGQSNEELAVWNANKDRITEPALNKLYIERAIQLYAQNKKHEELIKVYESKGELKLNADLQMLYLNSLDATENKPAALKACQLLLKENADFVPALEWKGKYYFNKAEKKYQYEMAKYNKKKNNTTYAYLRRELKKISTDFRVARDVFLKLNQQDKSNKSYIKYLKNAYLRLNNKKEAAKWDKLLKY